MFISNAFSCMDEMKFRRLVETSSLKELSAEQKPRRMGRLGQVVEGGGKSLLFAIGNYVNHRLFGGAEKTSPRTFNQTQPFDRLVGSRHSFSFDLKSATDRWPLVFLFEVVQYLFDRYFASSVVNSAFACNIFEVPFVKLKRRFSQVCFVAGHPLDFTVLENY
ncbi:hypothetical protein Bca52824_064600 [Brassica carinata]|uniref:Uncharacterized protein n=1 Tax=Brassica carinata TaxID=52824 RepID=A0A8X7U8A7_BRACI|nr:hypothetical protein Bca52824_064600 [Brassica carinata]